MRLLFFTLSTTLLLNISALVFADENLDSCKTHLNGGEYVKAVEDGKHAIMSSPRNYESHFCLSEAWRFMGESKLAIVEMRQAEKLAIADDSLAIQSKSNEINEADKLSLEIKKFGPIYGRVGLLNFDLGHFDESLEAYTRQYELIKSLKNVDEEVTVLSTIANVYQAMHKPDTALDVYNKALALVTNEAVKSSVYNNIAIVYGSKEDFKQARLYFAKALDIDESLKDQRAYFAHLLNLGLNFGAEKNFTEELSMYNKALDKAHKTNDLYWEAVAHRYKGDFYRRMNNASLARKWFNSAFMLFAKAGATGDASGAQSAADDLDSIKSYAGVVLDVKGYTGVILAVSPKKDGTTTIKVVFKQSIPSSFTQDLQVGATLDQAAVKAAAESVKTFYSLASTRFFVDRTDLFAVGTGVLAKAANRELLALKVKEEVGKSLDFLSDDELNVAELFGTVSPGNENNALLIDVGRTTTIFKYYDKDSTAAQVMISKIDQGGMSAFGKNGKNSVTVAEKTIRGKLARQFKKILFKNNSFQHRMPVFLTGDVVRFVATFAKPGNDKDYVKLTRTDIHTFIKAVKSKQVSYFNPSLAKTENLMVEKWAAEEMRSIKESFKPEEMLVAAEYLDMMFREMKITEVYYSRWGNWLTGRLYQNSLAAEKLAVIYQ